MTKVPKLKAGSKVKPAFKLIQVSNGSIVIPANKVKKLEAIEAKEKNRLK